MSLKTDYKDYELAPSMGGQRHYRVTENADGTQSLTDVSEYLEIGDSFKAEDINATNSAVNDLANTPNDVTDLKMLGYTIPKEMPVKNYADSNGIYHQRVGRIDLGSLTYAYAGVSEGVPYGYFVVVIPDIVNPAIVSLNLYCSKYTSRYSLGQDKSIYITMGRNVVIVDSSFNDSASYKNAMKGVYLYYELATEITKSVDGNEVGTLKYVSNNATASENAFITLPSNFKIAYVYVGSGTNSTYSFVLINGITTRAFRFNIGANASTTYGYVWFDANNRRLSLDQFVDEGTNVTKSTNTKIEAYYI